MTLMADAPRIPTLFTPASGSTLAELYRQVEELELLQRLLAPVLDRSGIQCEVAAYREGRLLLICADAARALRARHSGARLMVELRQLDAFRALKRIEWRVRPAQQPTRQLPGAQRPRHEAAQLLAELASSTRDPQLRSALKKLSTRGLP